LSGALAMGVNAITSSGTLSAGATTLSGALAMGANTITTTGAVGTGNLTPRAAAEGGTPLNISTASGTFGPGKDISLLYYQDAVTTTSATPTLLLTVPIPTDTVCTVEATVTAVKDDCSGGAGYKYISTWLNTSGSLAQIGGPVLTSMESDESWNLTATDSGANLLFFATGKAATSIDWSITARRHVAYGKVA